MAKSGMTVLAVALGLLLTSIVSPLPSRAATTFGVTRRDDPQPNGCRPHDCSLREAIIAANAAPWSTIQLPARVYTLTIHGLDTSVPNPAIGDLDIKVPMTITGAGSKTTIVQFGSQAGHGVDRIFDVYSPKLVKISGITIRFGRDADARSGGCVRNTGNLTLDAVTVNGCTSPTRGAGIASAGTLLVRDSVVSNNQMTSVATSGDTGGGGGISNGRKADGTPAKVTIVRTSVRNNTAKNSGGSTSFGGGFSNVGTMTIQDSTVSGNVADSSGGGINGPTGSLTIQRSTFDGNKATRDAGGMDTDGILKVISSTFSNNQAGFQCAPADCRQAFAGGLLSTKSATTTVDNSTFSGNTCGTPGLSGGALLALGVVRIRSSTIVDNTCPVGAGFTNSSGDMRLMDTIVAGNHASGGGDCGGTVTSEGYNLFGSRTGCTFAGDTTGNVFPGDAKVGPLADNGGPTMTVALLAGSPAIDAGRPTGCLNTSDQPLTKDQRGLTRPAGGRCDIGAYELQP